MKTAFSFLHWDSRLCVCENVTVNVSAESASPVEVWLFRGEKDLLSR